MSNISSTVSNSLIAGTLDDDSISNSGSYVTIDADGGDDIVSNGTFFRKGGSNVSISGGGGNDSISNGNFFNDGGDSVTIDGGIGDDSIGNGGDFVTIDGGDDNDYVSNSGSSVTINGGEGDDRVSNSKASVTIDAGAGNDSIGNGGDFVTIDGGDDNDYVSNSGSSVTINGGAGSDTLSNGGGFSDGGDSVLIAAGSGDNSISNSGTNVSIKGDTGNDSVSNWGASVSIDLGAGDDSIHNTKGNSVTINGGAGNDTIWNDEGDALSINSGEGDDSIWNNDGDAMLIDGGTGNDSIYNNGDSVTIDGGIGDDSIRNYYGSNVLFNYRMGDGNDTIIGFGKTSTLSISGDSYSTQVSGDDLLVNVGDGSILLVGMASLTSANIEGAHGGENTLPTEGDDSITNTVDGAMINALGGNDTIRNYAVNVIINSGDDNDSIYNYSMSGGSSISADSGDDYILNFADKVTILGGDGNDSILNRNHGYLGGDKDTYGDVANSVSIVGGAGHDSISNDGSNVTISGGAGNDSIQNFGDGTSIYSGEGDDSIANGNYATIGVQNAFIDGGVGNDMIVNNGSNMTISGGAGNDYISINYSESLNYGSNILLLYTEGDDTVRGINETDTLRIGDGTATYSKEIVDNDMFLTTGNGVIKLNGAATLETVNIEGSLVGGGDTIPSDKIINNTVSGASIQGTVYNDTITNSGSNVTINALAGNDSISLSADAKNNLLVYTQSDGSDTVSGFKANDTVSIVGSSKYFKDSLDNDFIISMVGGGEIILKDAASLSANVNITGGKLSLRGGMDITNNSTGNLVNGTNANDKLINHAGGATILAGNGNDYIDNSTDAKYVLEEGLGYVTIDAGAGNDTILSYDPNVSISGGANADLISLKSSNFSGITVNAGTGNDTIYGNANDYGVLYEFRAGDGFDTIYNFGSNDTLSISGGSYTSEVDGDKVVVSVEGGGQITLIDAAGKDIYIYPTDNAKGKYLINSNDNSLLSGSSYADTIKNYGDNVTISAGNANDTIYNNKGDRTSINAGNGNDSIDGNNDYVTVSAGKGKDTITGNHWRSNLSGDADNDLISITTYWYNTLDGGAGDDTIIAGGSAHSVNGGSGKDLISLSGDALTVAGGADDDTIYGNTATSHLYEYGKGDGNDIIYNYGSNDSITISGSTWTTSTSGSNVIVKVADSGNITLDGAKGKTLNIYTDDDTPDPDSVTAQDVIKNFMGSLDTTSAAGKAALDQAVSVASGGYFANISAAIQQMTLDCAAAGNATTFLKDYCGIDLDNEDTGAISGSDAGGSSVKTAQSIVPEEGDLDSFTGNTFTTNGLNVQLARFDSNVNPYTISYSNLSNAAQRYIWQAFETWWTSGALNLIAESYGSNYGFDSLSSATVNKLYFGFENEASGTMATTWFWTNTSTGKVSQLAMTVNMYNYNSIDTSNPNGTRSGDGYYLDRVLSHEFTHAVMAANIDNFRDLPHFIAEGMAELTHGTDDDRKNEITTLAKNPTSLASALNLSYGSYYGYAGGYMFLRYLAKQAAEHYPTAINAGNLVGNGSVSKSNSDKRNDIVLAGTKLTVSKDFTDDALDLTNYASIKTVDATALAKGIEITGNISKNSIKTGVGNDTVFANVGNDTLRGGDGNDIIYGEAGNDKLYGDAGDDTLCGGSGNDTLTGGDGKDLFVHVADNDVITDYQADEDKIQLVEGSIVSSSVSGSNLVLDVGRYGSITVKGGASKNITVIDSDGNETTISPVKIRKYSNTSSTAKVTLASDYDVADATARTKAAIRIVGNAKANSIVGGSKNDTLYGKDGNDYLEGGAGNDKLYGQNDADTLWGGVGNDTLTGGDGNDLFVYSIGNDVIADYSTGDRISLGAAISKSSFSGNNAILTIGSNKLTIKNGKGKELSLIEADGTERTIIGGVSLLSDSSASKVTLGSTYSVADASARTTAIRLVGNSLDNTILGGTGKDTLYGKDGNDYLAGNAGNDKLYGQNGDDILWGGAGNDTLIGGDGADIFLYNNGDGKDVITDFIAKDDMLQITGDFSATYYKSSSKILFKVGDTASALTLKNISVTSADVFNINGDSYKISGTKLVKS